LYTGIAWFEARAIGYRTALCSWGYEARYEEGLLGEVAGQEYEANELDGRRRLSFGEALRGFQRGGINLHQAIDLGQLQDATDHPRDAS
jgi:hypothetical protein